MKLSLFKLQSLHNISGPMVQALMIISSVFSVYGTWEIYYFSLGGKWHVIHFTYFYKVKCILQFLIVLSKFFFVYLLTISLGGWIWTQVLLLKRSKKCNQTTRFLVQAFWFLLNTFSSFCFSHFQEPEWEFLKLRILAFSFYLSLLV